MSKMWFQMAKIGILVPTQQIKKRKIKLKDEYFDGKSYYGFNYIISEIDKSHKIKYISSIENELNSVDFVLYSITSYYDILNLINELRGKKYKSKIIVGGAGLLNFSLISKYIDIAVLGRGENIINDILDGKEFDYVWRKEKDNDIENIYKIGEAKRLLKIDDYNENAVGCSKKCYFCQYSWKNKYYTEGNCNEYKNWGVGKYEEILPYIDWNKYKYPYMLTSIDGFEESTRKIVNKNISDNEIKEKFNEIYKVNTNKAIIVKLYCIAGYPFENFNNNFSSFFNIIKKIDKISDKRCVIFITSVHFIPKPLTPMESESLNFLDFRKYFIDNDEQYKYKGNTFSIYFKSRTMTSYITALEECILNRCDFSHLNLIEKIFLSNKYKSLRAFEKHKIINKYFPKKLYFENNSEKIIPYIKYPKGFDGAKNKYYKNKEKYL